MLKDNRAVPERTAAASEVSSVLLQGEIGKCSAAHPAAYLAICENFR
jgi:hypothetical protein